jgi:DNA-binding phage protein
VPNHKSYHTYLINSLKDPEEAAAYLDSVFDDGDPEYILLALNNVAEARGLLSNMPDRSNQNWQEIYQQFTQQKVSDVSVLEMMLNTLGLRLSVAVKDS